MTPDPTRSVADLVRTARDPRATIQAQHAAFTVLVERFEEMAFATALRSCDEPEMARDACQEAFLVAWRRLSALREPAAFGGWLKRLIHTQCARVRRRRDRQVEIQDGADIAEVTDPAGDAAEVFSRREVRQLIRRAVTSLPAGEREAVILFYFLGEPLRAIARTLGVSAGLVGKRIYNARLQLRRALPRSITETFLATASPPAFSRRVRAGLFDEFVGEYRFPNRLDRRVIVRREGQILTSYAGGQRNVLASCRQDVLTPTEYDGEARFQRNRSGRVTGFVYYEFGRRLGVAHKVALVRDITGFDS
jgi:RNA polymerase sigma-70 factor (ECF subfamily)